MLTRLTSGVYADVKFMQIKQQLIIVFISKRHHEVIKNSVLQSPQAQDGVINVMFCLTKT